MPSSICVALPVLNGARYLGQAIESVLSQQGVDLTVRLVDNGSTDGSLAIAERYAAADPRVSVAVNDQDVGFYGSLNRILAETDADLFAVFACDDVMLDGNLARKARAIEEMGAGFAHSSVLTIDGEGAPIRVFPNHRDVPPVLEPPAFFGTISSENLVNPSSVLARTSELRAVGGFDGRCLYCADWLTWQRLSLRCRVATLREPLVAYRVHDGAGTATCHRDGINGRDAPASVDRVFLDGNMPAAWASWRDPLVAVAYSDVAQVLHRAGRRRVKQGWSGYMLMGRALARVPEDPFVRGRYEALVRDAGLGVPSFPLEAVVPDGVTEADAADLGRAVDEMGALLGRLVVAVDPDDVDASVAVLDPLFGGTSLDVVVVPVANGRTLLAPGQVVLAAWESELVEVAEAAGVAVWPYALPDPFGRAPDLSRWETVDPAACLP